MVKFLTLAAMFLMLSVNTFSQEDNSEGLMQLAEWMSGSFDTEKQSIADTNYFNIVLHMTKIWPDKPNGIWLYVEQSLASTPEKPYRQRIYFLSEIEEDSYASDIYELKEPEKAIGAWRDTDRLKGITPFDLEYKDGCTVFVSYDGFQYSGATNKGTCQTEWQGADYATSQVNVTKNQLKSWDRGFDKEGVYVWGAESGAYIFDKK